ncbi:MAG: hypothetical protein AMS26_02570 [Bacteroides sp. SM23_62]|nr:MAG: hypothetical protein AMS26_02570 [Bacteroides sp. SM23_62]
MGKMFCQLKKAIESLEEECKRRQLNQIVENEYIIWMNQRNEIECMILLVYDPSNIDTFIRLYSRIKKEDIKLTYCIVHQIPDGKYEFDIFRITEMSYLEHCNRVRPRR